MAVADRFVVVNGLRLHYLDYGGDGGPPLLFLHGLAGHAHVFDDVGAHFIDRYHVLSLDVRGRGESAWSPDGQYDMPAYVSDLAGIVGELGAAPVSLVGTSMGGLIAMHFAAAHPESVGRVVMNDIGPEIDPRGAARIRNYVGGAPESFPDMQTAAAWFREHYPETMRRLSEEAAERWVAYSLLPDKGHGFSWRMDPACRRPAPVRADAVDPWDALARITCPLLVLRGENSDILSEETVRKMVVTARDCRTALVKGSGHAPALVEPDAMEALDAFLIG